MSDAFQVQENFPFPIYCFKLSIKRVFMTSSYQPRQGGVIRIVNDEVTSDLEADVSKRADVPESVALEDRYIKAYLEQNSKRAQVCRRRIRSTRSSIGRLYLECSVEWRHARSRSSRGAEWCWSCAPVGAPSERPSSVRSQRMERGAATVEKQTSNGMTSARECLDAHFRRTTQDESDSQVSYNDTKANSEKLLQVHPCSPHESQR